MSDVSEAPFCACGGTPVVPPAAPVRFGVSPESATCDHARCDEPAAIALRFGDGTYLLGKTTYKQTFVRYCAAHGEMIVRGAVVCDVERFDQERHVEHVPLPRPGEHVRSLARKLANPRRGERPAKLSEQDNAALQELGLAASVHPKEVDALVARLGARKAAKELVRVVLTTSALATGAA